VTVEAYLSDLKASFKVLLRRRFAASGLDIQRFPGFTTGMLVSRLAPGSGTIVK